MSPSHERCSLSPDSKMVVIMVVIVSRADRRRATSNMTSIDGDRKPTIAPIVLQYGKLN